MILSHSPWSGIPLLAGPGTYAEGRPGRLLPSSSRRQQPFGRQSTIKQSFGLSHHVNSKGCVVTLPKETSVYRSCSLWLSFLFFPQGPGRSAIPQRGGPEAHMWAKTLISFLISSLNSSLVDLPRPGYPRHWRPGYPRHWRPVPPACTPRVVHIPPALTPRV